MSPPTRTNPRGARRGIEISTRYGVPVRSDWTDPFEGWMSESDWARCLAAELRRSPHMRDLLEDLRRAYREERRAWAARCAAHRRQCEDIDRQMEASR